jgi:AcrR family transcriptional regulator
VSHAAPTNHFADKDALLAELAIEGFDELGRDLAAAAEQSSDALRLRELGRAYIGFAQRRPGHYRVMFGRGFTKDVPPRLAEAGSRAFALLEQAIPAGRAGVPADAFLAWSVVHGAATLLLDGPIPPRVIASKDDREAVARLVDHVTDRVAALLGAG